MIPCARIRLCLTRANSLDSQLCSLNGTTALDVRAVTRFVLPPIQKPPRVRQTSDLHSSETLRPQLLLNAVHVHHDAYAAGTDDGKSEAERLTLTRTRTRG